MNEALWYFGRAAGVTALVLLTAVMALGILVRTGRSVPGLPRFAVTAVHRSTSLTAVAFLALHVGLLLFDRYAQLRLVDVVVPFIGSYRPLWLGLGTAALDLVTVVCASSLLRNRIGLRTWRSLHWAAYLLWPLAVLHCIGTGTDRSSTWLIIVVAACVATVGGAVAYRFLGRYDDDAPLQWVAAPVDLAGLQTGLDLDPIGRR